MSVVCRVSLINLKFVYIVSVWVSLLHHVFLLREIRVADDDDVEEETI